MGKAKQRKNQKASKDPFLALSEASYCAPISLHFLEMYLSIKHQKEVAQLLMSNTHSWERHYPPTAEHEDKVGKVVVACAGELALVGLWPKNHPRGSEAPRLLAAKVTQE